MEPARVVLFGRGNVYHRKKKHIFARYTVICFLDNSVEEQEIDIETGLAVYNPGCICDIGYDVIILLSYALGAMAKQLLQLGVASPKIAFGPQLMPYNTFEEMIFSDGKGHLLLRGADVFYVNYVNSGNAIDVKMDDANIEKIVPIIKGTPLYPGSGAMLASLPLKAFDDTYGFNRGTPVDRYYIECFLEENKDFIKGAVVEVGDRTYTRRYGTSITESMVLAVDRQDDSDHVFKGDLETGRGLPYESADCFVCTQTMQFIYDTRSVAQNILNVLKPGGAALVTVSGISQIIAYERRKFGHFWNFTDMSLERVFRECADVRSVKTRVYGNIKSATAFLYGLSYDELDPLELEHKDENYQVIIGAVVRKRDCTK